MSEDSFTEVTNESWFSRIGGAIKGIVVGLILFVVAFPLLFWNEGRAVKTYKTLKEGAGAVVSVAADKVDAANEGALVHMSGKAETDATLSDPIFSVSVNAIKLRRIVEMYQWDEKKDTKTEKKVGGGTKSTTTYSYSKSWSGSAIDSANFKKPDGHQNPGSMPFPGETWTADKVTLGAFTLSSSLVGKLGNFAPLAVESDAVLPESIRERGRVHNGGFYVGDPTTPQIGDVRITFKQAPPTDASLVAQQAGNSFVAYKAKTGKSFELLQTGTHTAEAMFEKAQKDNQVLTWILRLVGFILMMAGLNMIFKPLSVVADVLPILGSIVGAGTGLIAALIALTLSFVTIAVAWIVYRPLLGILLLAAGIGTAVAVKSKLKPAEAAAQPAAE